MTCDVRIYGHHRKKTATSPEISGYTDVCIVADISVFCWYQRCYVSCSAAAPPGPGRLRWHWPLPRGSNRSSLLIPRPFGGSVHRTDTPDTIASCTFLVGWWSLTDCQPESRCRRQIKKIHCRNNVNVILDISTSYASQCDSYLWPTASAAAQGQEFATICIQQRLVCQFSESIWWLPPLWGHPLAHSCAGKRMRTRI